MEHLDLQVIRQARKWIGEGQSVWLCTVLSTFGSAPRGPGAMLVALDDGQSRGSLSGGCVEEDFLERIQAHHFSPTNQIVCYGSGGLTPTRELPCGGVLNILIEQLPASDESNQQLELMEQALKGNTLLTRQIVLETSIRKLLPGTMEEPRTQVAESEVKIRIGAVNRLIIAGLSPVAEFCASFALALGYEVIVCEPRDELLGLFSLPGVEVKAILPALFISTGGCHEATAVVALTHDPRLDDLTMMEAVRTKAFYIGAMGSSRTSLKRLERLKRIGGLDEVALKRIRAPIGLPLGSKTPAEIAIAVMADIIRAANGVDQIDF